MIKDWVALEAAVRPDELSLVSAEPGSGVDKLTWGELDGRVGRLASQLRARGVGVGDRVAVLAINDPRFFELQFACMRLGAIFVPWSWRLTVPELYDVARDADPMVMVFDDANADKAHAVSHETGISHLVEWGGPDSAYERLIAESTESILGGLLDPAAVTHILYTSGTTGKPKGVLCTNATLVANAHNVAHSSRVAERGTHVLGFLPLFHAGGLNTLSNAALYWGGRVTTVAGFDPRRILQMLSDPGLAVTHGCLVLQHAEWMGQLDEFSTSAFPTLRAMFMGAWGPSAPAVYQAWIDRGVPVQLGYGASELGTHVTLVQRNHAGAVQRGTAGIALANQSVKIVDEHGSPAPTGTIGEIWVKGPAVSPGYWRKDPKDCITDGWFHSGDLGFLDETNELYVVGRLKEVYRSGGENVYPAEVENALQTMPGINEVAVIGVPSAKWGEVGLAVVVPADGADISRETIREFLSGALATFKIPGEVMLLDVMPRNTTEKVDKPLLREMWEAAAEAVTEA